MSRRWGGKMLAMIRLAGASSGFALLLASGALAQGLIPADFFNAPINPDGPAAIESNGLSFDATTNVITANGDVVLNYEGYTVTGQNLVFDRNTSDATFVGAVSIRDPSGNILETNDLKVTGGMKQALLSAMTITNYDGSRITADSTDYDQALRTLMANATYAPCGDCIDDEGRRVGWSVNTSQLTYNAEDGSLYLENPKLSLLGIPVAWLPFLYLPNTSSEALSRVRMPSVGYSEKYGARLTVPFTAYSSQWTDIILSPSLLSRQGGMLGAEWNQRFDNGSFTVTASGLYQFDREPFEGEVGDRDWRGALQSSGEFRPVEDWTVGWTYTGFTDAGYLEDYDLTTADSTVNQVYGTYLTDDTYFDVRVQQFNLLGNVTSAAQDRQGSAIPNARFEHIEELGDGRGRVEVSGRLLGVHREADAPRGDLNGVPYTFGYAGNKTRAAFQAGWQTQWIGAGGLVLTPYVGGRADVAYYDGDSALVDAPDEATLWSATPIAAMDVRYPMVASSGSTVHLIEPIAQLVYRGTDRTALGITNDDAQSFVFDDTNLFSYNRFSGSDRQETGLRANIGGRYQADFGEGSYIEVVGGQSFQLAGANAFTAPDQMQVGVGSGLESDASFAVLGTYARFASGLSLGAKAQIDNDDWSVARAGLGANWNNAGYSALVDYNYIAANADTGVLDDQHEIGAGIGIPIADYWTVQGNVYYDLVASELLQVGGGLVYDDGFLVAGGNITLTGPTHTSPDETRFTATFRLKAPAGLDVGYTGGVGN